MYSLRGNILYQLNDIIQCKVHENFQHSLLCFQHKGISAKFVTFGWCLEDFYAKQNVITLQKYDNEVALIKTTRHLVWGWWCSSTKAWNSMDCSYTTNEVLFFPSANWPIKFCSVYKSRLNFWGDIFKTYTLENK